MTSRERVLQAVNHQEPDRVPLDLGGSFVTSIHAQTLHHLRRRLGLQDRPVKLYDAVQMLGEVELDVVARLELDVLAVDDLRLRVGARGQFTKPFSLFDGTQILVPEDFDVELSPDGANWLLFQGQGANRQPALSMPVDGFYFDTIGYGEWDPQFQPPPLEQIAAACSRPSISDEALQVLAERAALLRRETDKALHLNPSCLGLCYVGRLTEFLCLLAADTAYVAELFMLCAQRSCLNLELLWQAVGENVDIVFLTGLDFGSQRCELMSPETFRATYLPALEVQYDYIHAHTTWKVFEHSCGSIANIIGDMAQAGLDIINPVQTTAAGMDPAWLKRTWGDKLTFWGGGVETQGVLQRGTPQQVRDQVRERIEIFAPGGGFVFCPDHNIQPNTPPENIIAAYEAAREFGQY